MRTESTSSVSNGSEPRVPNRSESTRPSSGYAPGHTAIDGVPGRPPVLDDSELDELAQRLTQRLGRPPRIHELIEAAGGCQRQRASRAIQRLRLGMAEKAVRTQIMLPPALEAELRLWIERWLAAAAHQLREIHADLEQRNDEALLDAQELLSEQKQQCAHVREQYENQARITSELVTANQTLHNEVAQLRAERDIANAVADELRRVIDTLKRPESREVG